MKQKLLALASALALCLSLAGCHISTPATVGAIGGQEIGSGLYLLAQFDAYQQAAQYAGEDQDPASVKSFLNETITPDGGEAVTVSDFVAPDHPGGAAPLCGGGSPVCRAGRRAGPRLHRPG